MTGRGQEAAPTERSEVRLSDDELALLQTAERPLGRIATVGSDGTPHVVPSGWIYNAALATIDVTGRNVADTKKYRDVTATGRAAIVIDGVASGATWEPWAIEIRGEATPVPGPPALIRISIDHVASWNLSAR